MRVTLREQRFDLDALLAAITPRTKLVFVATPNNPTGTMTTRAELRDYFARFPITCSRVVDQAYLEYIEHPDFPDAIEEYAKRGHRVLVLRTFSKIYGLAGSGSATASAPPSWCRASARCSARSTSRRPPRRLRSRASTTRPSSRGGAASTARRWTRSRRAARAGFEPLSPAFGNFLFVDLGEDAAALHARSCSAA